MTLEELQQAANAALAEITAAGSKEVLEQARVKFLGRKGLITLALRSLGSLPAEVRPQFGQEANRLKKLLETHLDEAQDRLKKAALQGRSSLQVSTSPCRAGGWMWAGCIHLPDHPGNLRYFHPNGLPGGGRAGNRNRLLQFRGPEHPQGPPGPGYAGHLLYLRRHGPAHPHLAHAGAGHGEATAAGADHRPRQNLPAGLGRDPHPHVSPGGGPPGGEGYLLCRSQGGSHRLCP